MTQVTNEETEAQRGQVSCPRLLSQDYSPGLSDPEAYALKFCDLERNVCSRTGTGKVPEASGEREMRARQSEGFKKASKRRRHLSCSRLALVSPDAPVVHPVSVSSA